VCIVPYTALKSLCREIGSMQERLHKLLRRADRPRSRPDDDARLAVAPTSASRAFLLDVSARFTRRGYAAAEFTLRMTREEIGSYLGITLETVSRTLSRFQARGLIDAHGKLIRIRDFAGLRAI
jgi:CRP/FNR family transcriptional regulator